MTDVLILGDGPAGLAAAITLRQQGISVAIARRQGRQAVRAGESLSSSALLSLKELGVSDGFYGDRHPPCFGNCSSWGDDRLSYFDFIQSPAGQGWYIDRPKFDRMLREKALALGTEIMDTDAITIMHRNVEGWHYGNISAKIVIDASGRNSWLGRQLDIERVVTDKQVAVITLLANELPRSNSHSMVEAVSDGWWYVADAGDQTVCIFFTDPDLHIREELTDTAYWDQKRSETIFVKHRVPAGTYSFVQGPELTSAASSHLAQYAGPGWFAAGDAACAMDPISSHGIAFALRSGIDAGLAVASSATAEYDQKIKLAVQLYNEQRTAIYQQEQRWADEPYWQRRHQPILVT